MLLEELDDVVGLLLLGDLQGGPARIIFDIRIRSGANKALSGFPH